MCVACRAERTRSSHDDPCPNCGLQLGGDSAIRVRDIGGCRTQLIDAIKFLPLLIGSIVLGIGILVLNFYLAGYNPSCLAGLIFIICFVIVPARTMSGWNRRVVRPENATELLILRAHGIEIHPLSATPGMLTIPWRRICTCRLKPLPFSIVLTALHIATTPSLDASIPRRLILAICTESDTAQDFMNEITHRLSEEQEQPLP